jgi:hypothetical protein
VWAFEAIVRQERTAGLIAIAGVIVALVRRRTGDRLVLAFVLPSFLAIASLPNQQLDYLAALWPPAALLGGRALSALLGAARLDRSRALTFAAVALVLAPSAAGAIAELRAARAPDTRLAARDWIERNVPSGAGVAFDRYHYVAPLLDAGRARRSEVGRKHVGANFADALDRALAGRPTYNLVPMLVLSDTLIFPPEVDSLPEAAAFRERAARDPFLVEQVFGTRNRTLDELRAAGADYVLVSSRWTDRFLVEEPPPRDNPLYLYWRRERADLLRVIEHPRVTELHRWEPSGGLVGPRVTLYRITPE